MTMLSIEERIAKLRAMADARADRLRREAEEIQARKARLAHEASRLFDRLAELDGIPVGQSGDVRLTEAIRDRSGPDHRIWCNGTGKRIFWFEIVHGADGKPAIINKLASDRIMTIDEAMAFAVAAIEAAFNDEVVASSIPF